MSTVAEMMTRGVHSLAPDDSLVKAARAMADLDVGTVPVCDGERLVGIVTDRDITIRGVAEERPLHVTRLADVMSDDVQSCSEQDDIDAVLERMKSAQIRRLPVVDGDSRLVGMLSLGDIALQERGASTGAALGRISEPADAPAEAGGGDTDAPAAHSSVDSGSAGEDGAAALEGDVASGSAGHLMSSGAAMATAFVAATGAATSAIVGAMAQAASGTLAATQDAARESTQTAADDTSRAVIEGEHETTDAAHHEQHPDRPPQGSSESHPG